MRSPSLPRLLAALLACSPLGATAADAPGAVVQIIMSQAQVRQAGIGLAAVAASPSAAAANDDALVLAGTVVPAADAVSMASAPVAGVVQQLHVETLESLAAGGALATLFSPAWMEMQRDYVQAVTQSRLAGEKLARDQALFADGIIARARLDETRAAARLASLAAEQRAQALRAGGLRAPAIAALSRGGGLSPLLVVRSPGPGVVLEIPVALGQQVDAGMPVARMVRDSAVRVELQATARQQQLLAAGDMLEVPGCVRLKVEAIGPALHSANQTVRIRARPVSAASCLKLNAFVEARPLKLSVPTGAGTVPADAIARRAGQDYVFVRTPQGFHAVPVSTGPAGAGLAWVRGALPQDAQVAVRGLAALKGAWIGLGEAGAADGKGGH